jgi:hypothetical protein
VADVVLLTVVGFQVPVIKLFEITGKIGIAEPEQIGVITVKVGITFGFTTMVKVEGVTEH